MRLAELTPATAPVELDGVPFHPQEAHHCGPASLLSVLEASGVETDYGTLVEKVYVPGLEGSLQLEMVAAARSFGLIAYTLPAEPAAVLAEVAAGRPVLVLLNLRTPRSPVWHYAVVVGFDAGRNRLLLHSGSEASGRRRARPWLRRWEWAGRWGMVLLEPGEWPAAPDRSRILDALSAFEETAPAAASHRAWSTAVDRWPGDPLAWLGLGNATFALGHADRAVEAFERALALDPKRLPARLNLAVSLAEAGRPCEGVHVLEGSGPPADHSLSSAFSGAERRLRRECSGSD